MIIYILAFTILIAFIGEIKSAPALGKHRVRHRGIRLFHRSPPILNCKFPSDIFSIPIDIDTSIIIFLRNKRTNTYVVSGVESSGQEYKVFTMDGTSISGQ